MLRLLICCLTLSISHAVYTQDCFDAAGDCTLAQPVEFNTTVEVVCGDTVWLNATQELCNTWDVPMGLNYAYQQDSIGIYILVEDCIEELMVTVDGVTNTPSGTGTASCDTRIVYHFAFDTDTIQQFLPCEQFLELETEWELQSGSCGCNNQWVNYTTDLYPCVDCGQQCIFVQGQSNIEGTDEGALVMVEYSWNGTVETAQINDWDGTTTELMCVPMADELSILNVNTFLPSGATGTVNADAIIVLHEGEAVMSEFYELSCDMSAVGTLSDTLVAASGCDSIVTVHTSLYDVPEIELEDAMGCMGDAVFLDVVCDEAVAYEWNTGATTAYLEVMETGEYTVSVTDENGCVHTASAHASYTDINIELQASVAGPLLINEWPLEVWEGAAVQMDIAVSGTPWNYEVLWNKGPEIGDTTYNYVALETGPFEVSVIDSLGCFGTETTEVIVRPNRVFVPTAFSPNEDGANDVLTIFSSPNIEEMRLQMFAEEGQLLFDSYLLSEPAGEGLQWEAWDAWFKGKQLLPQVVVYQLRYRGIRQEWRVLAGDVTIMH